MGCWALQLLFSLFSLLLSPLLYAITVYCRQFMENSPFLTVNISPSYSQPVMLLDHTYDVTIDNSEHNRILEIEIRPLWYLKYLGEQS